MTDIMIPAAAEEALPVFEGLKGSMVSGKEIAGIVGVTPPTVSKWRKGRARPSPAKQVFLTLMLAHWLEERENSGPYLYQARQCLKRQEICNASLSPQAIHEGVRMFKDWWNGQCGQAPTAASRRLV